MRRWIHFAVSVTPVTFEFGGHAESIDDLTEYTFSGLAIGTAAANRRVIVRFATGSSNRTGVSVTVGGAACSIVGDGVTTAAQAHGGAGTGSRSEVWITDAVFPTGTTADVVVTLSGGNLRCCVDSYAVYGANPTAYDIKKDTAADGAGDGVLTANLDSPASGAAFGFTSDGQASVTNTWTVLTEAHDSTAGGGESMSFTAAAKTYATAETGQTITCTRADTTGAAAMILISFAPE